MKYESTILKRLIDTYGVVGNPRYISEIIKEFIVRGKECFPNLFTYQADWLAHIDEFGLNPTYTVSYTGQSIYAPNTLERPVKSAILTGQTQRLPKINEYFRQGSYSAQLTPLVSDTRISSNIVIDGYSNVFIKCQVGWLCCLRTDGAATWNNEINLTLSPTTKFVAIFKKEDESNISVDDYYFEDIIESTNIKELGEKSNLISVKMPVLTTYNQENLFKNYIKDGSQWGKDHKCTTTDVKYSQNGGYVKIIGGSSLCYSGFVSPSLSRGTYKFSCKVKVGQVGDSYRILAHNNPNGAANNANGFVSDKITSTKEIETFEYVGYFNGANSMLLYTYYKGQEIEYYDIMFTKLSDDNVVEDYKVNPQKYEYKSNILTVNEDVTLRSNGSVCDELDLLTGKLTQRIDEDGEILAQEVVKTVDLTILDQNGQNVKQLMSFNGGTHFTTTSLESSPLPVVSVSVETDLEETLKVCSLEGNTM